MQGHLNFGGRWLCICSVALIVTGCGGRNPPSGFAPVTEIGVAESGKILREKEEILDPQTNWPGWRGPHGDGVAACTQAPLRWSESTAIKWQVELPGRGHGSPIVVRDLVLVPTALDQAEQQLFLAFDRESGELRWQTVIHEGGFPSSSELHRKGSNANGTLLSDGELVYGSFFNDGKITATACDMQGNIVWQTDLGPFASKFGFAPSPVAYQSFVIFAVDHWGGGHITALDHRSGEIAWRIRRPAVNSHSSPLIAEVAGKDQLLICGCEKVASFDPATGQRLWVVDGTAETTCGTMVATADLVFASGGYPDRETVCLNNDGTRMWSNRTKIYEPSLITNGQDLFAINDDGIAYCWDAKSGEEHWKKRLGNNFSASPVLCGEHIYVSDLKGNTYVFQATSAGYEEVAVNRLGDDCYASPAIVDGEIFLRVGYGQGAQRREKLIAIAE